MTSEKPIYLGGVQTECRRLGQETLAIELHTHSDLDSVILHVHDRLLAAGVDLESAFTAMGFSLEDRGEHGKEPGDLSTTDVGGATMARHLSGKISRTAEALLHYLRDPESGVRMVERELGAEAPAALRDYLVASGLYPMGTAVESLQSPIEVQKPWQKLKLDRVAEKMTARWKEGSFKKNRPRYDAALKQPIQRDPTPTQVAALLMPFIAGDCSDVAEKDSYSDALGAAVQMFYLTGLKVTDAVNLLAQAGLYPVPDSVPDDERALRERVGKDLKDRFSSEESVRQSLAGSYSHTLSLQQLAYLRRSSHQTGYSLSPEAAVDKTVREWLANTFSH